MKKILIAILSLLLIVTARSQSVVFADPTVGSIDVTNKLNVPIDANRLPLDSIVRLKMDIGNLSQTSILPAGTCKIKITLGSKLILDPAFVLASAPLNTYFAWTSSVSGSGQIIINGDLIADFPADQISLASFDLKAVSPGSSLVTTQFLVTNHNSPTVTLSDENPNNNAADLQYTVLEAFTVSITSQTNVTCFNGTNGSVTVLASGGAVPYEYKLDAGAYQASGTFTGLAAGTYTITAKDDVGQTTTVQVIITQPTAVSGSVTAQTNVSCYGGSNGSATVTGSGGTPGYTYSLDGSPFSATNTFTGLAMGTYTVTVKDINNCTGNVIITITQPTQITAQTGPSTIVTNITCFGAGDGSINLTFTATGGTGTLSYSYAWTRTGGGYNATTEDISGLSPGTYNVTITVTDANLCTNTFNTSAVITQPTALGGSASVTNVGCAGGSSGSVTVTGSGGTSPYQYKLGAGTYQVSGTFGGLAAGSYTVTVKDANACTYPVNFTITEAANPDVVLGSDFSDNLFPANGDENTIVYNATEVNGKLASVATLRIFKPAGYNILFDNTQTTITIGGIPYTLDNSKWVLTQPTSSYYELKRTGPSGNNELLCNERVYISIKVKRATVNKSTFNLNAQYRGATGEIILSNNNNSIILIGE